MSETTQTIYNDIHQQITDNIIDILEKGIIPWKQSFINGGNRLLGLPFNFTTDAQYKGINILLLWLNSITNEYTSNEWATLKQWNKAKESVKPKEKGTMIIKYDFRDKVIDGEVKSVPFVKRSYVFNRCQLKNYTPAVEEIIERENRVTKNDLIDGFINNTQAVIEHHGYEAVYNRVTDKVTMPPQENFIDTDFCSATENYYSTLFHEIGHWTGHSQRLDRFNEKFSKGNYAKEELVAELTASFLNAKFEIASNELENSAAYIATWLKALKDDKSLIVTAASAASKAVSYLEHLQL